MSRRADPYGRVRYDKSSYAVGKDGKVVQRVAYGNKRTRYKVVGDKVYETDAYGNARQQKFQVKQK